MAAQIPDEGPLTREQRNKVIQAVESHKIRHGLNEKDIARSCKGVGVSTVCQLLNGDYNHSTTDMHLRSLNNWIEQDERRRRAALGRRTITNTAVVHWIESAAEICRQNSFMGIVMGPSGIGKTITAKAITKKVVGSIYVLATQSNASQQKLLKTLCDKLNVGTSSRRKDLVGVNSFDRLCTALDNTDTLIVVDDADKLRETAIELLREVHDATGVPILLIGVVALWERILRMDDEDRGQLKSRFGIRYNLRKVLRNPKRGTTKPLFTLADVRAICSPPKVKLVGDAARYLLNVANRPGEGSFRRCLQLIEMAVRRVRNLKELSFEEIVPITSEDLGYVANTCDISGYDEDVYRAFGAINEATG